MSNPRGDQPRKIVEMFAEGKRFTEEVLQENKRLRLALEGQKNRTREIEEATEEELPGLRYRVQLLKEENLLFKNELLDIKTQFNEIEKENWDFSERYLHVERQNTSLLNLYVASQLLHSTLSFSEVIQIVKELVVNLVGSEAFDVCLYHHESGQLRVLASLGTSSHAGQELDTGEQVRVALDTGNRAIPSSAETQPDGQAMVVCVPLKLNGQVLGAIIIRELLAHKAGIEAIDHELFDLLGDHAISAIYSAYLFGKNRLHEDSTDWREAIEEMSQEASSLQGRDMAPAVMW